MTAKPWLSVILAAGLGTRMKSSKPKVLHDVAERPMLAHTAAAALEAGASGLAVVVGPDMDAVQSSLAEVAPQSRFFVQTDRLGTAHAVLAARDALSASDDDILVLYGDTPLLRAEVLRRLRASLEQGEGIAVLGFETPDPFGYGRLLLDETGALAAIREEKDATDAERAVRLCNSGVMAFRAGLLLPLLERIGNDNAKGEYYLTDVVALARQDGVSVGVVLCPEEDVAGVNDRVQLARVEAIMQSRLREAAMRGGVTLIAPDTVTFSYDTQLGQDVLIEPNVFFGPGVIVENNVKIRANCHIEHSRLRSGATVGPFARLRGGADVGRSVKIGNFVEIKNGQLEEGVKISHLSYVGDAHVGAGANIGAGTITCNYDGFTKHRTDIGAGAFIGSNSALVAPVRIGDGAFIGSGSVITRDVEAGALALERSEQVEKSGWAERNRQKQQKK